MKTKIQRVGKKEAAYVKEVLSNQFRSSASGSMLSKFEQAFADRFQTKYAIGHVNGTATLHSALYAAGVRPGDEVIVPPLTMSSTTFAVLQQDAIPIFADVDEETFTISPQAIEKLITPKTKAIITVALYGLSPDMNPIMKLAKKHKIMVIEDDAQCFLGYYHDKLVGSIGHLSSFSFQSSKHISAGEGGIVCTNDIELAEKVRKFAVLGYAAVGAKKGKISVDDIQNPNYNRHSCLGYNYRMSDLCSAVSLGQLEHLDELVERRIDVANLFIKAINGCPWLLPQKIPEGYKNSYWSLAVRITNDKVTWSEFRKKFMELGGDGIYATWKLTYLEPVFQNMNFSGKEDFMLKLYKKQFQKYKPGLCPVAEKIQSQILAFKTNYYNWNEAKKQARVLAKTIKFFSHSHS